MVQVHKKFTDEQVKELIEKYLRKEVGRRYLQEILGINKTRFFALIKAYRDNPSAFSVQYVLRGKTRAIPEAVETYLLKKSWEAFHPVSQKAISFLIIFLLMISARDGSSNFLLTLSNI